MIETYSFGHMVIDNNPYSSDLIIYPDGRIQDSWWRKEGHALQLDDIAAVIDAKPDIIVAGSGAVGFMKPIKGLQSQLIELGIELIVQPTSKAYETFNMLHGKGKNVAGCFHLTC